MDLINDRDADGNVIEAAPTFDYIQNKAIEEEHRKEQLEKQPVERQALPVLALTRGSVHRYVTPSADGATCRIEIDNAPYCSFCRKPFYIATECFKKDPKLKGQGKDGKGHRPRPQGSHPNSHKLSKRQHTINDEDEEASGPKDSTKPTFMAMQATGEDVNAAFGKTIKDNRGTFGSSLAMMATRTLPIRDAWIIDSGFAQHVCNNASTFVQINKYHGPPLKSVDASTFPSGLGTMNILCSVRGRRRWLVLDNVLFVPSAHVNLISVLQLLKRGAKIEFSGQGASIRSTTNRKSSCPASQYQGTLLDDGALHAS